ncbi:MAG: glycosyltransferase [Planctomycetes bacterium]|nr:glycosyltransferase [Planctomycetota bacterium]
MHKGQSVAVVVPALNEEASIATVVGGFRALPAVDHVLVIDNGSHDETAAKARAAGARVVPEARHGYGAALRTGIEHALELGAGIVVLVEADGTFAPADLGRLLAALEGGDLALGSRSDELHGALELGNRAMARLLAALWWRSSCPLSDVGCTYRAFTAPAWAALQGGACAEGPEFSPQMICAAFERGLRVREVPVRYFARSGGESKHTGSTWAVVRTALRMLRAILVKRLGPRR